MSDIPAAAALRSSEVSHAAFKLYSFYCAHRNEETGVSNPSQIQISRETSIGYSYVSELKSELADRGWIRALGGRKVFPLVGFEVASSDHPKILEELTIDASGKSSDSPKISDDPKISGRAKSSDSQKNSDKPKISRRVKSSDSQKNSDDPKISKLSPPTPPYKEVVLKNITTSSSSADEDAGEEVRSGRKAEDLEREVTEADIAYLQSLPENADINVRWVYRKLVDHYSKKRKKSTLKKLVDWCRMEIRPSKNGASVKTDEVSPDELWRAHYTNELRGLMRHADEGQSCAIETVLRQLPQLSWEQFQARRGELQDIGLEIA